MTSLRVVTIGGYGYDEPRFVRALQDARVDTFVDIRQRRGMRGPHYAFLNSARLQQILGSTGIRYVHVRELAPTTAVREAQKQADVSSGVSKRERTELSPEFIAKYRDTVLSAFDRESFLKLLGPARTMALFCVEAHPLACHRSIAAAFLRDQFGATVEHLRA